MRAFVSELRRRNVLRVAAAYALIAWIIIEAGSVLLPTFGAPAWAFRFYVIAVICGFIAALILAWAFEITSEGVKLDRDVVHADGATRPNRQTMNYVTIALLAVALAVSITFNITGVRDRSGVNVAFEGVPSIAVLPFASRSSNPENVLFADGIHDDLLLKLGNIGALKVISRTSVMEYRDTTKNIPQIGSELGVNTILEGTVQRVGDSVRINMRLLDAPTERRLWAQSYDRQLSMQNILAIQSEISASISGALQAALTPAERGRVEAMPTEDMRAFGLYMAGRGNLYQRRLETLQDAQQQFEEAMRIDPDYAAAYAGYADSVLLQMINHQSIPRAEALEIAQASLDKALALDPDLADAYATLGLLKTNVWSETRVGTENFEAEEAFRKALALNPNHASASMWFASLRASELRTAEAIELYEKAMDLDPLGRIPLSNLPTLYAEQGQNQKAIDLWLHAIETHPEWPTPYDYISIHLAGLGRLDESLAWNIRARELSTDPAMGGNIRAGIYMSLGDVEQARSVLADVPPGHPFTPLMAGFDAVIDGDLDRALEVFDAVIEQGANLPLFMLEIVSDVALLAGELEKSRRYLLQRQPLLQTDAKLRIDRITARDVVKLAYIHQQQGDRERAYELLHAALPVVQELPRLGMKGQGILDVQIFALLGRSEDALSAFEGAVDEGFRSSLMYDFWILQEDPFLVSIRDHPRYVAAMAIIEADLARMYERVIRAEETGRWDELREKVAGTLQVNVYGL